MDINTNINWFDKYSLSIQNDNIDKYINKLKTFNKNNIENKINKLEEIYINNINELKNIISEDINNYINNFESKNSLIILQKELDIIKILTKYTLQNKILELDFYVPCLTIFLQLSEILRNRLNQKEFIINKNNKNNKGNPLYRCSYKFCTYKDNCNYFYNGNNNKICYQDHYVHNMVSYDIKILLDYINNNKILIDNINTINISHNKEILKTINTISFVINHMESELRNKCLYLPENETDLFYFIKK